MSKFSDIAIDDAIVRRASRGDVKAHEIIYRAFATPVYSICLRFSRVPAHAEDLTQETFIEVMRSIGSYRGEAPLGLFVGVGGVRIRGVRAIHLHGLERLHRAFGVGLGRAERQGCDEESHVLHGVRPF